MKICFIADARSPIARNWINYFVVSGYEVHIISSYSCNPDLIPEATIYNLPIAMSWFLKHQTIKTTESKKDEFSRLTWLKKLRDGKSAQYTFNFRYVIASLEIYFYKSRARQIIEEIKPDLIHAMRIPFEGILASLAKPDNIPLLISVWGNDFTLFADKFYLIKRQTYQALARANALHSDCHRDLNLAAKYGFSQEKLTRVLPGSGGIQNSIFYVGTPTMTLRQKLQIPDDAPVIINSRGFRGYVRNDLFFLTIPQVVEKYPNVIFICVNMKGHPIAEKYIKQLQIQKNVRLLPSVSREEMGDLFRLALITISLSEHDGTPNTLIEAMACGAFPIVSDLVSIREWIDNEVNGLLCNLASPLSITQSILRALSDEPLRQQAKLHNQKIIAKRADYRTVMMNVENFYQEIISCQK